MAYEVSYPLSIRRAVEAVLLEYPAWVMRYGQRIGELRDLACSGGDPYRERVSGGSPPLPDAQRYVEAADRDSTLAQLEARIEPVRQAMQRLSPTERLIISETYFRPAGSPGAEMVDWRPVAAKFRMGRNAYFRVRNRGLKKIARVLFGSFADEMRP